MKTPMMISASAASENLDAIINECLENSEQIIVCAPKGSVIMLSYDDYLALINIKTQLNADNIPATPGTTSPADNMISFDSMDDIQKFISGN